MVYSLFKITPAVPTLLIIVTEGFNLERITSTVAIQILCSSYSRFYSFHTQVIYQLTRSIQNILFPSLKP